MSRSPIPCSCFQMVQPTPAGMAGIGLVMAIAAVAFAAVAAGAAARRSKAVVPLMVATAGAGLISALSSVGADTDGARPWWEHLSPPWGGVAAIAFHCMVAASSIGATVGVVVLIRRLRARPTPSPDTTPAAPGTSTSSSERTPR